MGGSGFQKSIDPLGYRVHGAVAGKKGGGKKRGGGGGGTDPNAGFYGYLAQMQQMQQQQAEAARKAQEEAFQAQQRAAGSQAQQMGESAAMQQLGLAGSMQNIRDVNALKQAQAAASAAGTQATGGGYDIGQARQEALTNLGAAAGSLPATMQNIPVSPTMTNPALAGLAGSQTPASKKANIFTMPSMSNIQFGGA